MVGGDSDAALRRAAKLGDGWIGNRIYTEEQLDSVLDSLRGCLDEYGRTGTSRSSPRWRWPDADTLPALRRQGRHRDDGRPLVAGHP